jgi:hypothetical protein
MAASLPAASGCKNQRIFLNQQYKYLIVALPEERLFAKKIVFPANLVCIIQTMFLDNSRALFNLARENHQKKTKPKPPTCTLKI